MHAPVSAVDGVDGVGQSLVQPGLRTGQGHVLVAVGEVGEDDGGARPPDARRAMFREDAGGEAGDVAVSPAYSAPYKVEAIPEPDVWQSSAEKPVVRPHDQDGPLVCAISTIIIGHTPIGSTL